MTEIKIKFTHNKKIKSRNTILKYTRIEMSNKGSDITDRVTLNLYIPPWYNWNSVVESCDKRHNLDLDLNLHMTIMFPVIFDISILVSIHLHRVKIRGGSSISSSHLYVTLFASLKVLNNCWNGRWIFTRN
jgi:hypothetical protein